MKKITTNIPYKLLQQVNENDQQRYLAFFIYLKKLYSNSCIYNYSADDLSIKIGVSKSKIRRHVTYFLKNGWAKYHGKNLILNKFVDFCQESYTVNIETLHSEKDILDHILIQQLITKRNQCLYAFKVRSDQQLSQNKKWLTKSEYRNVTHNYRKIKNFSGEISPSFSISILSLAKLYNRSTGYITSLMKRFERKGMLMITRNKKVVLRCCKSIFNSIKDTLDYTYFSKGYVVKVSPSAITILNKSGVAIK